MISKEKNNEVFVWIWLPEMTIPVVAGKLIIENGQAIFNYGKSYLERDNAIPIYDKELPLKRGPISTLKGLSIPNCIRDASPDAWGRRVIINKLFGNKNRQIDKVELSELTYLLLSGSDRIGALDFQRSPTEYEPRYATNATLGELLELAERVTKQLPLTPELDQALYHGSSIGGARPKALIESDHKKYIAKFSTSTDLYSVVKAEFIAMRLAEIAGLTVAPVSLTRCLHKDVLLVERFDRIQTKQGWQRKLMLSSLTLFELDEMMARYASYEIFAEIIRYRFKQAASTLKALFARLVFNILVGNTDDHARNHAAFWDGTYLSLTPAYDICPQSRMGNEASQAMLISDMKRHSNLSTCLEAAPHFLLSKKEALRLMEHQIKIIGAHWNNVCDLAELSIIDRKLFWGRQFLNPYAFDDLEGDAYFLKTLAEEIRHP